MAKKDSALPFEALKDRLKATEPSWRILVSREFGLRWIVEQAWAELGYKEVVAEIVKRTDYRFRVDVAVFGMVLAEILAPQSKLALAEWRDRSLFLPRGRGADRGRVLQEHGRARGRLRPRGGVAQREARIA